MISLLRIFAQVMNCEGIYYIQSEEKGYYFLQNRPEEKGEIHKISNIEISNYLAYNETNVISDPKTSPLEIMQKQKRLLSDFNSQPILQPPPLKELKSVIVASLPNNPNQYLIFTNSSTYNGVTTRKFSIRNLRTAYICSILISNSEIII